MRTVRTLVLASLVCALGMVVGSGAALADCTQASPWPSFTRSAGSAQRIIIGTVTWTPGGAVNNRFTLRVDEVLRGQAPATIDFAAFRSGAPQPICPEDSLLRVRQVGDRLALAYGAHLPGLNRPITAVALVKPVDDPEGVLASLMPKMEWLTVAQVRAIAALPPTDSVIMSAPSASPLLLSGLIGALAAWVFARRRRRVLGA